MKNDTPFSTFARMSALAGSAQAAEDRIAAIPAGPTLIDTIDDLEWHSDVESRIEVGQTK